VSSAEAIRRHLARWPLVPPVAIEGIAGGINAQVWLVRTGTGKFVAKAAHASQLVAGLEVALALEAAGFSAGGPLRTTSGEIAIPLEDDHALALLQFVPGRPLDRTNTEDRVRIGATLGAVHSILRQHARPTTLARWPWRWLTNFEKTPLPAALRVAVTNAVRRAEALASELRLTAGVVHGDVSGRDFLFDEATGKTGLVDWGGAMYGPLLYDLGSFAALSRLTGTGRESFVASYLTACSLSPRELSALDAFIRLRWAVQARYFSWRIAHEVRIGLESDRENENGLRDAIEALGLAHHARR
jgi:homoserine kinase type II